MMLVKGFQSSRLSSPPQGCQPQLEHPPTPKKKVSLSLPLLVASLRGNGVVYNAAIVALRSLTAYFQEQRLHFNHRLSYINKILKFICLHNSLWMSLRPDKFLNILTDISLADTAKRATTGMSKALSTESASGVRGTGRAMFTLSEESD